jgi:hypothetical protein
MAGGQVPQGRRPVVQGPIRGEVEARFCLGRWGLANHDLVGFG